MKRNIFLILLAFLFLGFVWLARQPDRDLYFHRSIESNLQPNRIERNVSSITRWPQWFHSLDQVRILNPQAGELPGTFHVGSILELRVDPHHALKKPFQLKVRVQEYQPEQVLALQFIEDSTGRLSKLFDQITWKIEFQPKANGNQSLQNNPRKSGKHVGQGNQGTVLLGTAIAHTCHWRARLLGGIAEKILMNQVFYPDLIKLAELRQPFSADLPQQALGLSGPGL